MFAFYSVEKDADFRNPALKPKVHNTGIAMFEQLTNRKWRTSWPPSFARSSSSVPSPSWNTAWTMIWYSLFFVYS